MAGFKQWSDGDALTPADLDEFLMGQVVMRFPNDSARASALPSPVAGMRTYLADTGLEYIFANGVWAFTSAFIKKVTGETVTNSTTLQEDDVFQFTLPIGTYRVEAFIHYDAPTAADIKVDWTFSGVFASHSRSCIGPGLSTTNVEDGTMRSSGHFHYTAVPYGATTSTRGVIHEDLYLEVSTSGSMKLRYAQNTANASALTVSGGSKMYITRLA